MKQFFGYNTEQECLKFWSKEYLENPKWKRTEKQIKICDDASVFPQTFSKSKTIIKIETDKETISYSI